MGLKHPASKPLEEEPQAKKLRTEDSLIPEQQFLARNKVNRLISLNLLKSSNYEIILKF